jgi:tight adherence protein B
MQGSLAPFIYVLAFLAVVLAIQSIASIVFSARERTKGINRRLSMLKSGMAPEDVFSALVRRSNAPNIRNQRVLGAYDALAVYCRQAGLSITPLRLIAFVAVATLSLWLVAITLLRGGSGLGMFAGAVVSFIGAAGLSTAAAWVWLNGRRTARLRKLEEQLPLALDVVVRAIRAGHPVVSAVQLAADELGDPIGSEFGLIVDEYTYGSEFKTALLSFARRTGSQDAHFFAVSVGIQSETGGNLAEILDGLASVIRDRRALAQKVKALSSEGKASAMILSLLPIFLISILMLLQPKFYTEKFSDPIFWPIVTAVLILYLVGWLIIRRIINFKY